MTTPGFLVLESRRLLAALFIASAIWLVTQDWKLALMTLALVLATAWGWQLTKVYRWFADPEQLPPISNPGLGVFFVMFMLCVAETPLEPRRPRGLSLIQQTPLSLCETRR